jgi:hypothetical protein
MNTIAQTTGKSTQSFSLWRGKYHLAPLMLRLVIGYGFMVHGWAKLTSGPANFEKLPRTACRWRGALDVAIVYCQKAIFPEIDPAPLRNRACNAKLAKIASKG